MTEQRLPERYFALLLKYAQRTNAARGGVLALSSVLLVIFYRNTIHAGLAILTIVVLSIITALAALLYIHLQKENNFRRGTTTLWGLLIFQILADWAAFVIGIHVSGGPLSPAPILMVLHVGVLAVVLPSPMLYGLLAFEAGLYVLQIEAYLRGWLQPLRLPHQFQVAIPPSDLRGIVILFTLGIILNGLLVSYQARELHAARRAAEQKGEFMNHMSAVIYRSLSYASFPEIYQMLVDHLGKMFGADAVYLTRWDEQHQEAIKLAASGPLREAYGTMPIPRGARTLTSSLRQVQRVLPIEDVFKTEYLSPEIAALFPTRSMLAIPLMDHDNKTFWGALSFSFHQPRKFTREEIEQAQYVADYLSLLLSYSHLYQRALEQADLLYRLTQHVTGLTSDLRHTTLLPAIVESAQALLSSRHAALVRYDSEQSRITCPYSVGLAEAALQDMLSALQEMPVQFFEKDVLWSPKQDADSDALPRSLSQALSAAGCQAAGFFPLGNAWERLGTLVLCWDEPRAITRQEVAIVRLFAERAAAVLRNAELYARATEEALTDPLTGLPNRRALKQRLEHEINHASLHGYTFTILILDMNGFKSINDTYGHPAGDWCLQQITRGLREVVRQSDFLARYGGDEFVIILPETTPPAAEVVIRKISAAIQLINKKVSERYAANLALSVGAANFPLDGNDLEGLLKIADDRLYTAKRVDRGESEV